MAQVTTIANFDNILTSTIQHIQDELATQWHNDHGGLYALRVFGGFEEYVGGDNIFENLNTTRDDSVKSRGRNATIALNELQHLRPAEFEPKVLNGAIALNEFDLASNRGPQEVIDMWDSRKNNAILTMKDEFNRQFFQGVGTVDEFGGANLIVSSAPTTGTVGGIDRSVAANSFWRNQITSSVGSFAAGGVDAFRTMYNKCARGALSNHTDVIITDQTTHEAYEKTQVGNQRYQNPSARALADGSFDALAFKNSAVLWDFEMQSGEAVFLNFKCFKYKVNSMFNFAVKPPKASDDQFVISSLLATFGNYCTNAPRYLGRLTGITA